MAKVRITSLGKNAKQLNWPVNPGMLAKPDVEVNKTLKPVPREDANLEAEKGETAVADMTGSGIPQQYNIAGKPHSQGGTPLNLPGKSFIFSKDADMKIKDEKIQKMFGMAPSKSGYTPAEIAKKYDLNKYHKILGDDDTDDLQKETAEMMIGQYNMKLAKLALVQESLKGFPQGIPAIAEPYVTAGIINPEELAMTQSQQEIPGGTEMRYGGPVKRKVRIVSLPKAGDGKSVPTQEELKKKMDAFAAMELQRKAKEKEAAAKAAQEPGIWENIKQFGLKQVKPILDWYYDPTSTYEALNQALDEGFKKGFDHPVTGKKSPVTGMNAPKEFTYADAVKTLNEKAALKAKQYEALQKFYAANEQKLKGVTTPEIDATKKKQELQVAKTAAKPVKTLPNKDVEVIYTDEEF